MSNLELLNQSLAELESQFARHQRFVRSVLDGELPESDCPASNCRHRQVLSAVLLDTIGVLEDTRKAFKSKQLEMLRKKLLRVLAEQFEAGDHAEQLHAK